MTLTPEILHLLDAKLVTDPDDRDCCGCGEQISDDTPVYDIADFPAGTWHVHARASFCADCLDHDDVNDPAELDRLRRDADIRARALAGQPYEF